MWLTERSFLDAQVVLQYNCLYYLNCRIKHATSTWVPSPTDFNCSAVLSFYRWRIYTQRNEVTWSSWYRRVVDQQGTVLSPGSRPTAPLGKTYCNCPLHSKTFLLLERYILNKTLAETISYTFCNKNCINCIWKDVFDVNFCSRTLPYMAWNPS